MNSQLTFLDTPMGFILAEVERKPKPKVKHEWYIRTQFKGDWLFLWKTHTNGGGEWVHESALTINGGKRKPLRYKTNAGAKYAVKRHLNSDVIWEVVEWIEKS